MRFDKRDRETLVKQEAIDQYQEHCYMLGRVFSNEPLTQGEVDSTNDQCVREAADELTMAAQDFTTIEGGDPELIEML